MAGYSVYMLAVVLVLPSVCDALTAAEKALFHATVTVTESSTTYTVASDGVPTHDYGPFPSADNPNTVSAKDFTFSIPKTPSVASEEGCVPMGAVGMAINGVAFYNPYTLEQTDAVENEVMDSCGGHPSPNGQYHYHQYPFCVYQDTNNEFLGVALDGFPIYGIKDENGVELTSADLDKCHGRYYNGQYQYHMTRDFPYILGCFKGSVTLDDRQQRDCWLSVADDYDDSADNNTDNNTDDDTDDDTDNNNDDDANNDDSNTDGENGSNIVVPSLLLIASAAVLGW